MKIDIFSHICPKKFIDVFDKLPVSWETVGRTTTRLFGGRALWDVEKRLEIMERYEDYVQILIPTGDVVEPYFSPKDSARLAQIFNDALAELVAKYPEKFVGAVAAVPMNDVDAALEEIERTVSMGFKGILMHTPVFSYEEGRPAELGYNYETVKSLDSPEFMPIYESMSKHNLPIWIHPTGQGGVPLYSGDKRGKYALYHLFGWPLESAAAMVRLVCGGILAKYTNLRFIIHHCGSGIVPVLAGRIGYEFDKFKSAGVVKYDNPEDDPFTSTRLVDYLRMFYADTALNGDTAGLACGHEFFGAEHILFGTDAPFDMADGNKFIKNTIDAVYRMPVSDADKKKIFEDNARRLLRLPV